MSDHTNARARKLKTLVRLITEKSSNVDFKIGLENIESWTGRFQESESDFEGEGVRFEPGDLLFGKLRPYLAKAWVADREGAAVGDFFVIRPDDAIDADFLRHTLLTPGVIDEVSSSVYGAKMPRVNWEFMRELEVLAPEREVQQAVIKFLDRETAEIDAFIADQEQLIELITERRAATISHAVTKGLDPTVPMKDSGIEWLGEIPATWAVGTARRFFRSRDSERIPLSSEERSYRQGDYPYFGASGVIDSVDDYLFSERLVLVSEDGANLILRSKPIAFVADGKYWVNNHAHILEPLTGFPDFWAHRLDSAPVAPWVTGAAQPKLTIESLMGLPVACPTNPGEFREIEDYLDRELSGLNATIADAREAVALSLERRAALISAAVTGKIDVRQHPSASSAHSEVA